MVNGFLSPKNGYYQMVIPYKDVDGKWKKKWISTGLKIKPGNKRKAQAMLDEARMNFKPPLIAESTELQTMLYAEYLVDYWLPVEKQNVRASTYAGYEGNANTIIAPYFREKGIRLVDLTTRDIQEFYNLQQTRVAPATVKHYHAEIHRSLYHAVRIGLIPANPATMTDRPRDVQKTVKFYTPDEVEELIEKSKNDPLGLMIKITAFYGFRRSEVVGLKWSAIDFDKGTITISHTVINVKKDGKRQLVCEDKTKNMSSYRTLPLIDTFKQELEQLRIETDLNKQICGDAYCRDYEEYIFVNPIGELFNPNYVTDHFQVILKQNGLRKITFHQLRHSCASMLVRAGVPMKQVQEWLGHSDFSTTANRYSHLEYDAKEDTARTMEEVLGLDKMNYSDSANKA